MIRINRLEQQTHYDYNAKIRKSTELKQQELDLQDRINKLADMVKGVVEQDPHALLDPTKAIKGATEKPDYSFFDHFLKFDPTSVNLSAKQLAEAYKIA